MTRKTGVTNSNLTRARKAKNDEFYTQLTDIEKELKNYWPHFKGKTIFLNCDDPYESNFFKYFALNFETFGLKKLIATCYGTSPIKEGQLSLDDILYLQEEDKDRDGARVPYKVIINKVEDINGDGAYDMQDLDTIIKTWPNTLQILKGDGDFRSEECVELLKEADIVISNPPFSLFREYVAQLMEYDKKFIIMGNQNALTYKEIFPLIKDNKMWLGTNTNKTMEFRVPDSYDVSTKGRVDEEGNKYLKVPAISWYTNLDHKKRNEELFLFRDYTPEKYPYYDNYDAINVDRVADIPRDFDGVMGVPITFLNSYCPEQFEVVGLLQSSTNEQAGIPNLRYYNDFKEMRQDMSYTGASGGKANGNPVLKGKSRKGNFLYNETTGEYVHSAYARVVIKNKSPKAPKH